MTNALQVFNYDGTKIRVIEKDGTAWFVAKDVCDVLGLRNARKAVSELYDSEKATVTISYGSQNRHVNIINEPALYKLIFKSRKSEAQKFQDWIFYDVLPDIHKYGVYMSDKAKELYKTSPETITQLLDSYVAQNKALQAQIDSMRANAKLGEIMLALPGTICFGEAAKIYRQQGFDIGRNRLIRLCVDLGWLCKQECQRYKPSQKGIEKGVVNTELDANGCIRITSRPMLTSKGVNELYKVLLIAERPIEALF